MFDITRRDFLIGSAMLVTAPLACGTAQTAVKKIPMAMNLSGIADWEAGFPFRNLMFGARKWLTRNADGSGPFNTDQIDKIPLDPNGYPLELPFSGNGLSTPQIVSTLIPNRQTPGRYVLLYDGEGEFRQDLGTRIISQAPGRVVLEMRHAGAEAYEGFWITRSKKGNHVRNIRIVTEAEESVDLIKQPFRPEFLAFCKPFHVLRFMDWTVTNASLEQEWSKRKKPTFYTMVGSSGDADGFWGPPPPPSEYLLSGGVAWELIIQLCNQLKISPWICVPHRATAEYKRSLAELLLKTLDPKLQIYVEYSNEVWNWGFQQAQWMIRNKELGDFLTRKGIQAWNDPAGTQGAAHPERIGELNVRTFKIFDQVFEQNRKRLVRVSAAQNSWFDAVDRQIKYVMANGGCDALSTGGYFGPDDAIYARWKTAGAALTADHVIADMRAVMQGPWRKNKTDEANLAKQLGLSYLVYEGGQHIQPEAQQELPYMPALKAAQTHPGMYDLYRELLDTHHAVGTKLFGAFASIGEQGTRWGSWGHASRYGQPLSETPKLRAILEANTLKK